MGLTMKERKAVTKEAAKRYQRAGNKEKGLILDEFVKLTGYNCSYATFLLRDRGRKLKVNLKGVNMVIVIGEGKKMKARKKGKKIRPRSLPGSQKDLGYDWMKKDQDF